MRRIVLCWRLEADLKSHMSYVLFLFWRWCEGEEGGVVLISVIFLKVSECVDGSIGHSFYIVVWGEYCVGNGNNGEN